LKEQGLRYLAEARKRTGLPVVTEVLETRAWTWWRSTATSPDRGANIQNFTLLRRVGEIGKPVLLKRGMATTNPRVPALGRVHPRGGQSQRDPLRAGIRTFEPATRFTLDLNAVPVLKKLSHLPVVVDPSHAPALGPGGADGQGLGGVRADGLIIEVHPRPEEALSDGPQSLKPSKFAQLMRELRPVAEAVGRGL